MAFFNKAGNILQRTVSKHINQEISSSTPSLFQVIRCMSSSKLFIGGISYSTDDTSLREAFSNYGQVVDARVIVDRETGRSRGFGFVTFNDPLEASSALQALDGQDLHGRRVKVNYAHERAQGPGFGGGYNNAGYNNAGYYNAGYNNAGYNNGGYDNGGYNSRGGYSDGGNQTGGGNYGFDGNHSGTGNNFSSGVGSSANNSADNQYYSVAGGSDNFATSGPAAAGGFGNDSGLGYSTTNQFDNSNVDSSMANRDDGYNQNGHLEENEFADRKA